MACPQGAREDDRALLDEDAAVSPTVSAADEPQESKQLRNVSDAEPRGAALSGEMTSIARFILVTEFCERLAFYGIQGNLVLLMTSRLGKSPSSADALAMVFSGTCYMTPLLGGWLADSRWGRYDTILRFCIVYLFGLVLLAVASDKAIASDGIALTALALVALGTGGIKPNVSSFGAEQMQEAGPAAVQSFFNWFYWSINLGSFIALSVVVYIQQEVDFVLGYSVPAGCMLLAILSFVAGKRRYRIHRPHGSVLSEVLRVAGHAIRASRGMCCCGSGRKAVGSLRQSSGGPLPDLLVSRACNVGRLLPIMATFTLYWTVYAQMSSTFFNQGEAMNLRIGGFQLPVAVLNIFNTIIILVLVPLLERVVYPALARRGIKPSMLARIGLGYVLSALSMVCAWAVERERLRLVHEGRVITQELAGREVVAADMSVMWQVPQFLLIGASEVFASISGLEFAFAQSPRALRSVVMAINLVATGLGSYVGAALIQVVNAATKSDEWVADDVNHGHLDRFFLLLLLLLGANLLVFGVLARSFRGRGHPSRAAEEEEEAAAEEAEHRRIHDDKSAAASVTESRVVMDVPVLHPDVLRHDSMDLEAHPLRRSAHRSASVMSPSVTPRGLLGRLRATSK